MNLKKILCLSLFFVLSSCLLPSKEIKDINQENYSDIVAGVEIESDFKPVYIQAPPVNIIQSLKMPYGLKSDVRADNVPLNEFLLSLSDKYKANITVDSSLVKHVSLNLKHVSLPQILDHLSKMYPIEYQYYNSSWLVRPVTISTKIYNIQNLNISRSGQSSLAVPRASNQVTASSLNLASDKKAALDDSSTLLISEFSNSTQWSDLSTTLQNLLQKPKEEAVNVNPTTGTITVKAYKQTHDIISNFISNLNYKLSQQILIEARILEVGLNSEYSGGVVFSNNYFSYDGAKGLVSYYSSNSGFSDVINMLKTQGKVNILSSPRLAVMHQQRAIIKVGGDVYYATGTSQNNLENTSTAQSNILVAYQPFFSGLVLDVTAFVDDYNNISMHVHPYVSVVTPDLMNLPLQNPITGTLIQDAFIRMAKTQIRETDTIISAPSGKMIVIAGLMLKGYNTSHDSPGNANIVTNNKDTYKNTEIIILLKPTIMNHSKWKKMLQQSLERIDTLGDKSV